MKERSCFWDNLKGLLITLVVFGHFIYDFATNLQGSIVNDIFTYIYIFHMPAFVFCSGYFSKSSNACSIKSLIKLSVCYVLLNTFFALYCCVYEGASVQLLTPYASAWYILSLITWRLIIKYVSKIKWILPIAFIAALLIGFWSEFSNILSLSRTVAFFPFFLMGYHLNQEKLEKHILNKTTVKTVLGIVVSIVGSICLLVIISRVNIPISVITMQPYLSAKHIVYRGFIFISATAAIIAMMYSVPNVKIPLLTKIGKNSLFIYLIHRFITFGFSIVFPHTNYSKVYLIYAFAATIAVVIILATDKLNEWFHAFLNSIVNIMAGQKSETGKKVISILLVICLVILSIPLMNATINRLNRAEPEQKIDIPSTIDDSIVISYVGDLILLKDQVESAYDSQTGEYNFDPMFEYAEKYLSQSDLSIGIFEGPTAGGEKGYSTSDFSDKAKLSINFPDSFAQAVKNSGIDFVTTANNHLLDMGIDGAMRTLDLLDEIGLAHTGSFRNKEERDTVSIIDVEGVKIAVLAYSWFVNRHSTDEIVKNYPYLTTILPDKDDENFTRLMGEIENDFAKAKDSDADLIIVMPHMGTQFSHETDEFQDYWNKKFSELGADIILGGHTQAVQPIEQIGNTMVVNCPGKFANSYIRYDGDATSIVEIYINKETKKPVANAVIPMYTQEFKSGYFRAMPIYDILTRNDIYDQMAHIDLERINQVHELTTEIMLGEKITTDNVQPRYFFINERYCEYSYSLLDDFDKYKDTELYKLISSASDIVYIGDSITNGSHNNGHPWYEPLMTKFKNKNVKNISQPYITVQEMIDNYSDEIAASKSDLYIVAIGMHDVQFQDKKKCAMTPQEYVKRMEDLTSLILKSNQKAKIVLLSPWATLDNDRYATLGQDEKIAEIKKYSTGLKVFADSHSFLFIDQNELILSFFETHQRYQYTPNGVQPNSTKGIDLYSWAVMEAGIS